MARARICRGGAPVGCASDSLRRFSPRPPRAPPGAALRPLANAAMRFASIGLRLAGLRLARLLSRDGSRVEASSIVLSVLRVVSSVKDCVFVDVRVESLPGVTAADVEVHVGDFLAFLSRDYFPPCVHRVTRPRGGRASASAGAAGRLSFPFLVRPRNDHVLDTRGFDPSGAKADRLVEVSDVSCAHLRKLFDARGKRLLDGRRAAEAAEAARKERARKFREAFLLCEVEGMSYEDAAAVMGCPVKTVSTRLFRARQRFSSLVSRLIKV